MYKEKFDKVVNEEVQLSEIENELELYDYLEAVYYCLMEYIGLNDFSISMYLKELVEDEIIETKEKTNKEIVLSIRDDILYYLKKDMNYCLYEEKDID